VKSLLHFRAEGRSVQPGKGGIWGIGTALFGFSWSRTVQKAGNRGWEIIASRKRSQTSCIPHHWLPVCWRCSRQVSFPLRNRGAEAAVFTDQIEIVSSLFLFDCCISQQTDRCSASPRLVLSHSHKPVAAILWRGTGLGCRRAGLIPGCCIPCMPSVFTSPSVIWG